MNKILLQDDQEVLVESYSDDESKTPILGDDTSSEVRDLLTRKVELERWHKKHQLHMERVEVSLFVKNLCMVRRGRNEEILSVIDLYF